MSLDWHVYYIDSEDIISVKTGKMKDLLSEYLYICTTLAITNRITTASSIHLYL